MLCVAIDQWDVQEVVKRIVNELQVRGYSTWFGSLSVSLFCEVSYRESVSSNPKLEQTWTI